MSGASITARLTVELNASTYADGIQSPNETKEHFAALLEVLAKRLRASNEDNFVRSLHDDATNDEFGIISLAISWGATW